MECRRCHETSWMECRARRSQGGATGPGAGPGPAGNGRATAACARRGGLGEPAADRAAPGPAGHPGTTAEPRPAAIRRAGRGPGVLRQPAFRRSRQRGGARRIRAGRRPEPDAPGQPGGIPLLRQGPIEPDPRQPGRPGADVALGDLRRASGRLGLPDAAFGQRDRPRADRAQPAAACRRHARGNPRGVLLGEPAGPRPVGEHPWHPGLRAGQHVGRRHAPELPAERPPAAQRDALRRSRAAQRGGHRQGRQLGHGRRRGDRRDRQLPHPGGPRPGQAGQAGRWPGAPHQRPGRRRQWHPLHRQRGLRHRHRGLGHAGRRQRAPPGRLRPGDQGQHWRAAHRRLVQSRGRAAGQAFAGGLLRLCDALATGQAWRRPAAGPAPAVQLPDHPGVLRRRQHAQHREPGALGKARQQRRACAELRHRLRLRAGQPAGGLQGQALLRRQPQPPADPATRYHPRLLDHLPDRHLRRAGAEHLDLRSRRALHAARQLWPGVLLRQGAAGLQPAAGEHLGGRLPCGRRHDPQGRPRPR